MMGVPVLRCPVCGLLFEDDNDTTHECPPGFRPSGHSSPAITLTIYAQLFDSEKRLAESRKMMQANFEGVAT